MSSDLKYKTLFEDAPIALWEEDFSEVKSILQSELPEGVPIHEFLENNPDLVKSCALKVRIIDFNHQAVLLHEASSKEELRANLGSILTEESFHSFKEQVEAIFKNQTECETVGVVLTIKGSKRYVRFKWMVVSGHEELYDRVFVSTQDITEQHLYQKKLEKSEELLRNLMNSVPGVVFRASVEEGWPILFATGGSKHLLEVSDSASLFQQIHPDDRNGWIQAQSRLLSNGSVSREYRLQPSNGKTLWVLEQSRLTTSISGQSPYFEGIITDITSRVKAEANWRTSELKFKNLFNAISDPVFVYPNEEEENSCFIETNSFAEEVYGYTREEFLNMRPKEILPREDHFKRTYDDRQKRLRHESIIVFQNTHRKKDGTLFPVEVASSAYYLGEQRVIISIVRDLTERQNMERKQRQWGHILEQAMESIVITDIQGQIEYVNPAFETLTGYTKDEVLGKNPRILKSGIQSKSYYEELWKTILAGNVWYGRIINRLKDGTLVTEEGSISPIRDQFGNITHFVSVKKNVSKEVLLEKKLQQAQKMEAVGRLAGGIAHDFNNVLTAILGYGEILGKSLNNSIPESKYVDQILKSANRAKDLVRHILSFSRVESQDLGPIHVIPVLKEALKFIRSALPSSIHLEEAINVETDTILGNPTNLHQIVMNLCSNAQQAMIKKGGDLLVSLQQRELQPSETVGFRNLEPGSYLVLQVVDTGPGIEEEHLTKIFDPFFTTKDVGKGTGLGLSVVHGIVNSHKGDIKVESTLGKGTSISVFLPVTDKIPKQLKPEPTEIPGGTENIMLIDDEPDVGDALKIRLEGLGYKIKLFQDSTEALNAFIENPDYYSLILTDLTMPNLSGMDLAIEIRKVKKEIPVILCTGYHETITRDDALKKGINRFFIKPVRFRKLGLSIRELLDGSL